MSERARIRLITRGDDMGAFRAGNLAIIDAFHNGILRNASIMLPAPCIQHAVKLAKQESQLCFGLHVTLTSEWDAPRWGPISSPETVPSLLDEEGYFFRTTMEMYERGIVIEEMMREVQAQFMCAKMMGLDLSYLDEHMGVGWLFRPDDKKRLEEELTDFARRVGLVWHKDATERYLPCNSPQALIDHLPLLTPGTYVLITHPSYPDEEMKQIVGPSALSRGQIALERSNDYVMLCHPEVRRTIQKLGIEVVRYDEVAD